MVPDALYLEYLRYWIHRPVKDNYVLYRFGEMPAEMQSKSRRDGLLPDWGQIITIEYHRGRCAV